MVITVNHSTLLSFHFFLLLSFFCVIHVIMAALENEVLRNPKPSLVDRSVLELSTDKLVPPDIYVDRALLRARVGYDEVCEEGPFRAHKSAWSDSPDSDMELVAEAKARILELQKEAESLEEAYRNYQQRAVRSTISHMLPPRPLSPQQAHPSHHPEFPLTKQLSHKSPHKSKVLHKSLCPQFHFSATYDTKNFIPPAQPRVTFSEDHNRHMSTVFTDHSLNSLAQPRILKDETPRDENFASSRRLSSTPHTSPRKKLQKEIGEGMYKIFYPAKTLQGMWHESRSNINCLSLIEAVVSSVALPELWPDGQLPQAPHEEVVTSGDFSSELSPPRSPQLKSTARDQCRYHLARLYQGQCEISIHFDIERVNTNYLISVLVSSVQQRYSRSSPAQSLPHSLRRSILKISQGFCQVNWSSVDFALNLCHN